MEKSIAVLIAAHVLGDFLLQPHWLVARKGQPFFLLLHGWIHAALVYLLYQAWTGWGLPLTVLLLHLGIDLLKQRSHPRDARAFAWDQALHLLSLLGVGWIFITLDLQPAFQGHGYGAMVGFAGFIATVQGVGLFVGKVMGSLREKNGLALNGLDNGGAMIGNLERALIFLLIFIEQPAGIGFLVAAKSILRFEEAKKQKLAEYVLIGTLLSFTLAIALAVATRWAIVTHGARLTGGA